MDIRKATGLLLLVGLLAASAAWAGPAIETPNAEFNFGKVAQRAVVSHIFWIKSVGDDTLRITKVLPGCGCTEAPLEDSVLAPGDSTRLRIFFSTKSFVGYVTKRPSILTNAGGQTFFKIYAQLLPQPEKATPLVLVPSVLDVSQFTEIPRRKGKFLIKNVSDRDYTIKPIDWARDYFDIDLPEKVKAGETVQGTVEVHEDKIPEEFTHSLTFQIDDNEGTYYSLPVQRSYRVKVSSTDK
jgi:hypothetical protein